MLFAKPETRIPKWLPTHRGDEVAPSVQITVPARRTPAARPTITTSNVSEGVPKVLIADPEQRGRAHAVRVLSDHRVQFSVAPDAAMVLRLLEQNQYALCILDAAVLAGASLQQLAKTLLRTQAHPFVIVTSATGANSERRMAHSVHAKEFVTKPIARDQIHLIVERALASHAG